MKAHCPKCNKITKQKTCPQGNKCSQCGTIYKPDGSVFKPPADKPGKDNYRYMKD